MATISEKRHAKNIANLNLLNTHIIALADQYAPSNQQLKLSRLRDLYDEAVRKQQNVNTLIASYSIALDQRKIIFKPLNRQLTRLRKAYKGTNDITQVELEDFMAIVRKLKGRSKIKPYFKTDYSISQSAYEQCASHMDMLISLLHSTPNYAPNETEYKIETYQVKKERMQFSTQAVADAFVPFNIACKLRNQTLYNGKENLVDIANNAKDYLFAILDADSREYKAIGRIKFRKI